MNSNNVMHFNVFKQTKEVSSVSESRDIFQGASVATLCEVFPARSVHSVNTPNFKLNSERITSM